MTDPTPITTSPPPTPTAVSPTSALPLAFRGRIFTAENGYAPRWLLELRIRAGIGAIMNKRDWWIKWSRNDGEIRERWFKEFERELITQTVASSTKHWEVPYQLDDALLARYSKLPQDGSDDEKRAFVDKVCSTIEYNVLWNRDHWETWGEEPDDDDEEPFSETPEQFKEKNELFAWYGQIVWYFDLVQLNSKFREEVLVNNAEPSVEWVKLGSEAAVAKSMELLLAVYDGTVTKASFCEFCPEGDHRPEIVDALWFHVDKIMAEQREIRSCITKTLEDVITSHELDQPGKPVVGFVSPGPVQETWMSDSIISDELKRKFTSEVAVLENVAEDEKDWHPESNNQVLDLVHPSLFCCVFGETKQVPSSWLDSSNNKDDLAARMQRMAFAASELAENPYRGRAEYQWIPSEFKVEANGDVHILSYINNLHPIKHRAMYESIASIFKQFVPMFDRVLSCLLNGGGPGPTLDIPEPYSREPSDVPDHPSIPEMLDLEVTGKPFSLRGRPVQVVVKIAEIHLTPENPSYPGGSWHVEGSDAEQLVATGIYYFGCENITESKLAFRVMVHSPQYAQHDHLGMNAIYGLENQHRLVQNLGAVTAVEDRCIVFPNTLQHHVDPFELDDKTKPGVRKILAFFLVDLSKRIPSTAVIPPQQNDWLKELCGDAVRPLRVLPDVVEQGNLSELLGTGMTLEQAKENRVKLMEERKPTPEDDEDVDDYELFFSLCEH